MLNRWDCENLIGYESVPCNVMLIKVVQDYNFDERMVKYAMHLMIMFFPLGNLRNLVNIPVKIVGQIEHSDSCKMHE